MKVASQALGRYVLGRPYHLPRKPCARLPQGQYTRSLHNAVPKSWPLRLAIVGSGPAGFYSAHRVMTRIPDISIDMYEQLPVPFGLVRFGVAPDHPEVKNCQDRFKGIAESPNFNFIGNVSVGADISLPDLRDNYDMILFAYGASKDRELGIPGEHLTGIYSARAFVGWYNGLPEYAGLSPNLRSGETAVIIGQGNVALDVARILLSGVDRPGFRNTDITEQALHELSRSTIKNVRIVGRRGPLQASYTIKEVRELIQLAGAGFEAVDSNLLPGPDTKLPRAQKRITDLFKKHATSTKRDSTAPKWPWTVGFDFLSAPQAFIGSRDVQNHLSAISFARTAFTEEKTAFDPVARVKNTEQVFSISASTAFRSIGYKAEPLPDMESLGIRFDNKAGTIPNLGGRILNGDKHIPGLYCAGWVKRGPTGVIATTMEDGFATAELIAEDCAGKTSTKHGWDAVKSQLPHATNWQDWLKIDAAEREKGKMLGKEREKIQSITEMLNIIR